MTIESNETINITLSNPTNASILDGAGVLTIVDNDTCSVGTPTGSVTVQPTCATTTGTIVFTTQSGVEYSINGTTYQSSATFTAVAAGSYTLKVRYTTDNTCTATGVTVTLYVPICAVSDTAGPINGLVGATIASVLVNDTLNRVAITASNITLTGITVPSGVTLNSNGTITIAPNTPAGTITLTYQICENLNPTNCDTATVTISVGSCLDFPVNDCDGDGVTNGQEISNGTNPNDCCSFILTSQTLNPSLQWLAADCDGDGVSNSQEINDGTNPLNPCSYKVVSQTLTPSLQWLAADCDGDGVTNGQEIIDGTALNNPCEAILANATLPLSQEFLEGDCDGDGLSNGEEIGANPNIPFDPNGNNIPDYLEINSHTPSDDDLEIFNFVTPNGDGNNDVFVIRNIENYPKNELEIYNRWGVKVYDAIGYGQNGKFFRGISEGRVTVNQVSELPVGTYWYILKYKNASDQWKQRVGYLYLNK